MDLPGSGFAVLRILFVSGYIVCSSNREWPCCISDIVNILAYLVQITGYRYLCLWTLDGSQDRLLDTVDKLNCSYMDRIVVRPD